MEYTIPLDRYINNAGNLFRCIFKRTCILQHKASTFNGCTEIAKKQINESMEEVIKDTLTLEMETCMDYKEIGFPHDTYWNELRLYIDKYKVQPWTLYNQMKNNIGNGLYASFFRYYAIGLTDDIKTLENWAEMVRL